MLKVTFVGKSDIGWVRENNEDAFVVSADLNFAALADGMGGAAAGELASDFFISSAMTVFTEHDGKPPHTLLENTFELANRRILDHSIENPDHRGMGCTAELLTFFDQSYALGHVGDSRTYLLRDKKLEHLTHDHSFVQELVNKGLISAEEARHHRMRHVILRAVGLSKAMEVELVYGQALPGDLFLLCSDGLTDMVEDEQIQSILIEPIELDQKAQKLIDTALDSGGYDNVTVVLCFVEMTSPV